MITICAKKDLPELLTREKFDNILSINDPDRQTFWDLQRREKWKEKLMNNAKNVLCLYFDDATPDSLDLFSNRLALHLPAKVHIEQIIDFAYTTRGKTLVHCAMGISRSTAAAMIYLMEKGKTFSEAKAIILNIRPQAAPNPFMLKLYCQIKGIPSVNYL